jgi:hypothetical protein
MRIDYQFSVCKTLTAPYRSWKCIQKGSLYIEIGLGRWNLQCPSALYLSDIIPDRVLSTILDMGLGEAQHRLVIIDLLPPDKTLLSNAL